MNINNHNYSLQSNNNQVNFTPLNANLALVFKKLCILLLRCDFFNKSN